MLKQGTIQEKIARIQSKVSDLVREVENKAQKYKFFTEEQVFRMLKPFLNEERLTLLISDEVSQPLIHERDGNVHYVRYLKKMEIFDGEEKLVFYFWACGQNTDFAKALGASSTYCIKYMLSKFFLMPVTDKSDPDFEEETKGKGKFLNSFLEKHGLDKY